MCGGCAFGGEDGDFGAVFQNEVGGLPAIAEGFKQQPEPFALADDAVAGAALSLEVSAEAEVFLREGAELGVGGAGGGRFGLLAPALYGGLDVAGEDLGEVVVTEELVLVVDAG